MTSIYLVVAIILLFTVSAGLLRVFLGPTDADRMMAAQLFGSCGIAILLVLSKGMENEVLLDIALIFALLAVLATVTFVRRAWHPTLQEGEHNDD